MEILFFSICICISMYFDINNKYKEREFNICNTLEYFSRDWKIYFFYYGIFYYLYLQTTIPAPNKPLWQYYFPLKLSILMMGIIVANIHNYFKNLLFKREHSLRNVCIVIAVTFFINVCVASIIVQIIKNITGINLWFLIYSWFSIDLLIKFYSYSALES